MLLRIGSINPAKDYVKVSSKIYYNANINFKRSYCQKKDQSNIVDYVNTFGLGAEEGSSEWRDKKLCVTNNIFLLLFLLLFSLSCLLISELKVAGLFKQVVELSEVCFSTFID